MRKVSVRHARLAMDKKLWRWTRISYSRLYRDETHFTGKEGSTTTRLMDLQGLSADDIPWLVCRVAEISQLTPVYCGCVINNVLRAIIREAGEGTSQLKKVFPALNKDGLDIELLGEAMTRIKTVNLVDNFLTTSDSTVIFQAILTEEEVELENLMIAFNDLGEVESELMAGVVVRMKSVCLRMASLKTSQVTAIFQAILSHEDLELENLDLGNGGMLKHGSVKKNPIYIFVVLKYILLGIEVLLQGVPKNGQSWELYW